MKDVSVYSEKLARKVTIAKMGSKKQSALGWMNSGWSKSGGWFAPVEK